MQQGCPGPPMAQDENRVMLERRLARFSPCKEVFDEPKEGVHQGGVGENNGDGEQFERNAKAIFYQKPPPCVGAATLPDAWSPFPGGIDECFFVRLCHASPPCRARFLLAEMNYLLLF